VTRLAAQRLREAGFAPSAEHPHRFVRGREAVDGLAPDHLVSRGDLEVPSLAGAIAVKAAAYEARREGRDLEDLVRLLALVEDVEALRGEVKPAERRRLGSIVGLKDGAHRAWSIAVDPDNARAAFARLADA
jgi:hypothetical protein